MKPEAARAMIGYVVVGPRIIKARFRKATVVQTYAPTANSIKKEIDKFYEDLQRTI